MGVLIWNSAFKPFVYIPRSNKKNFFIIILATLGLPCCTWAFYSCGEWELFSVVVYGLLTAVVVGSRAWPLCVMCYLPGLGIELASLALAGGSPTTGPAAKSFLRLSNLFVKPGENLVFTVWFGLPWWLRWKSVCPQWGRPEIFDPWAGKIPWRRKWQPTPVFLLGESHGRRSLVGYSPRGRKESDTTERLHFPFFSLGC